MDTSAPMLVDENGKPKRHPLNDWYRTPNMERLAAQGVRFSNFYSHNVCSPTRVSMMNGQNSARHRCTDYIFPWKNNREIDNRSTRWQLLGRFHLNGTGEVLRKAMLHSQIYSERLVSKRSMSVKLTLPRKIGKGRTLELVFDVNVAGTCFGAPGSYYGTRGFGVGSKTCMPCAAFGKIPWSEYFSHRGPYP